MAKHARPRDGRSLMRGVLAGAPWLLLTARDAVVTCVLGLLLVAVAPVVVGWKSTVVVSGSMMPQIRPGDVISAAPPDDRVEPGTIVLVDDPAHPGELLMHRVIRFDDAGRMITQGDANLTADTTPVPMANVVGLPRIRVPSIGMPYLWIRQGDYLPVAAAGILLLVLLLWRPSSGRPPTDPFYAGTHRLPVPSGGAPIRNAAALFRYFGPFPVQPNGPLKPPQRFPRGGTMRGTHMRANILKAAQVVVKNYGRGRGVAVAAGMLACAGMVWSSSHATFTASTENGGNTLQAGSVAIADNDGGSTAMFTPAALAPGDTGEACIGVTYTGTLTPTAIKMYFPPAVAEESLAGAGYIPWDDSDAAEMDDVTTLKVEVNSLNLDGPLTFPTCPVGGVGTWSELVPASSIRSLIADKDTYDDTTFTAPAIAKDKYRLFRFTYLLPSGADNDVQGDGIKFGVTWEAQK